MSVSSVLMVCNMDVKRVDEEPLAHLALLPHPLVEVVALGVEVKELEGVLEDVLPLLAQLIQQDIAGKISMNYYIQTLI